MRLVHLRDGVLEIRWTWLPYWLAVNPRLKTELERQLKDVVLLNGATTSESDLDALHSWLLRKLHGMFPDFVGLEVYLGSLKAVEEPARA